MSVWKKNDAGESVNIIKKKKSRKWKVNWGDENEKKKIVWKRIMKKEEKKRKETRYMRPKNKQTEKVVYIIRKEIGAGIIRETEKI